MQIGVIYGNPEVTSGGNALKFYASVRLEVRRRMTHENSKGESMGIRVKAKVGKYGLSDMLVKQQASLIVIGCLKKLCGFPSNVEE
jgi:RecA/RadA recombinase